MDKKSANGFFLRMLAIAVVLAMYGIIFSIWLHFSSLPVTYNPPPIKLPKSNAYDYYLAASKAIVCKMQITEALLNAPPCDPAIYRRAGTGMIGGPGAKGSMPPMPGMGGGMPGMGMGMGMPGMSGMTIAKLPPGVPQECTLTRPYNTKEKQAVLDANARAFELLEKAYNCKQCCIPYRSDNDTRHLNYEEIRPLLDLQYELYLAEGKNWDAALVDLKQYKASIDLLHNCGSSHYYTAMSSRRKVRRHLYQLMGDLSSDQAMTLAGRLQQLLNDMPTATAIGASKEREELWNSASSLNERDWREQIGSNARSDDFWNSGEFVIKCEELKTKLFGLAYSRRGYLAAMEEAYGQVDEELGKPFQSMSFAIPRILNENLKSYINGEYKGMIFTYTAQKALDDMLILSLLLKAYKTQHGKYPASLAQLSPNYIKSLPQDPFAKSGNYTYKKVNDNYTLYSVGPNSKDDNGNAIYGTGGILEKNIYGDIVAGASR